MAGFMDGGNGLTVARHQSKGRAARGGFFRGLKTGAPPALTVGQSMSLSAKHDALVEMFTLLPDDEERFRHILALGRRYPALAPALHTDDRLLPGCVSRLWFVPEFRDGKCRFHMDADAQISKGIAALLCDFYNGETPADIVTTEPAFLNEIGLPQALSANRSNALASLRGRIKAFADACLRGAG
jgi:cysteine desulfuration protein SufE